MPTLDNDLLIQKEVGTVDEDTGLNTSVADVYYGTKATSNLFAGTYENTIKYTVYTEIPSDTKTIEDIEYMQDISKEICDATDEGVTTTLKDKRGSYTDPNTPAEYGVIKAKDGNCWMTDNLNLYSMTISAEDSDFESGTYTIPNTSNWSGNQYASALVHHATNSGYTDQVYYSWTTAVALTNGSTTTQQNQSICPKSWQLPINGDKNTNKTYAKLMNEYGVVTGSDLTDEGHDSYILGFTRYYGNWYYANATERNQGIWSFFWSSSAEPSGYNAHTLTYNASESLAQDDREKACGMSIRCVSRD